MELPKNFERCPVCHNKETVTRLACANEPSIPQGAFVSLEKLVVPIQDANRLTVPQVKAILCHFDICANCGLRYCTRAEIVNVPVQVQHRSGDVLKSLGLNPNAAR